MGAPPAGRWRTHAEITRHDATREPRMKATITVPAGFVPYLRKGLFGEWGYANEQLASLSLQFEGGLPEGSYFTLLHTFFTILTLLFEIGPRDSDTQGEVVINLGIGGTYVVRGLGKSIWC